MSVISAPIAKPVLLSAPIAKSLAPALDAGRVSEIIMGMLPMDANARITASDIRMSDAVAQTGLGGKASFEAFTRALAHRGLRTLYGTFADVEKACEGLPPFAAHAVRTLVADYGKAKGDVRAGMFRATLARALHKTATLGQKTKTPAINGKAVVVSIAPAQEEARMLPVSPLAVACGAMSIDGPRMGEIRTDWQVAASAEHARVAEQALQAITAKQEASRVVQATESALPDVSADALIEALLMRADRLAIIQALLSDSDLALLSAERAARHENPSMILPVARKVRAKKQA